MYALSSLMLPVHYNTVLWNPWSLMLLYILVGPLRAIVQEWLVQKKEYYPVNTLLSKLTDFPSTFVKHNKQDQGSNLFDDEDMNAWEAEARRWARTLLLVTSDEQHLERILGVCFAYHFLLKLKNIEAIVLRSGISSCMQHIFFVILFISIYLLFKGDFLCSL